MACCLRPSTTAGDDFVANVGRTVTITLKSAGGSGAFKLVHIRYAGDQLDEDPPFQFTVKSGSNMLVVLAEASTPGLLLQMIEVCDDGTEQILDRFHFDPKNPGRGYFIAGS